jgi:predicted RNA-binding Zn-ribbon protein involved in translation (DUF1610 family)
MNTTEGPYAVQCPNCGLQYLTLVQYTIQLRNADALWKCPKCGSDAFFDDENFEEYYANMED